MMSVVVTSVDQKKADIDQKKTVLKAAKVEVDEMAEKIKFNQEKKTGLCIRTLDKKNLSVALSFLGKESNAYRACKYWKACIDELNSGEDGAMNYNNNRDTSSGVTAAAVISTVP